MGGGALLIKGLILELFEQMVLLSDERLTYVMTCCALYFKQVIQCYVNSYMYIIDQLNIIN